MDAFVVRMNMYKEYFYAVRWTTSFTSEYRRDKTVISPAAFRPVCAYSCGMLVTITPLSDEGWPLQRFRTAFVRSSPGKLFVREEPDNIRNRRLLVARVLDVGTLDPLPGVRPLIDVRLVVVDCDSFTLTGFERIESPSGTRLREVAQSWLVQPIVEHG